MCWSLTHLSQGWQIIASQDPVPSHCLYPPIIYRLSLALGVWRGAGGGGVREAEIAVISMTAESVKEALQLPGLWLHSKSARVAAITHSSFSAVYVH